MKKILIGLISIIIAISIIVIITLTLKYKNVAQQINSNIVAENNINNEFVNFPEKKQEAKINEDNTIYFPDKNFENAIYDSLKINYKLTVEDAKKVTELNLENCDIENIAGIEFFTNLESLNLMKNKIKDISNIEELTKLEKLFLGTNLIKDVTPITNLKNLEVLNIGYNEITDISPIRNLDKIDYPFINGNPILNFDILYSKVEQMSVNSARALKISTSDSYIVNEKANKKEEYRNNQIAVEEMRKWVSTNINSNMTDLEKEYKIINHLLDKVYYALDGERASETDVYGMYINGNTVCFGYTLLFEYLANFAGLENYKVETQLPTEMISAGIENHTWNLVKIDDKYYQLDLTWADEVLDYKYINISNETMENLHNNQLPIYRLEAYPETNEDMPEDIQIQYQEYRYITD